MDFNQITVLISECKMKYGKDCPNKRLGIRNVSTYLVRWVWKTFFSCTRDVAIVYRFDVAWICEFGSAVWTSIYLSIYLSICMYSMYKQIAYP